MIFLISNQSKFDLRGQVVKGRAGSLRSGLLGFYFLEIKSLGRVGLG